MHALLLERVKEPLTLAELPMPKLLDGQVLVKIQYAAINHRDIWIRKGQYAGIKTPIVLGSDGAGVYNGEEVMLYPSKNWGSHELFQSASYEILGLPDQGTFAEFIAVDKDQVFPKPAHLALEQAAGLPLAGLTAYRALFTRAKAQVADTVLVTGIGGGVATIALQMAMAHGCRCFVTSSDPKKIEQACKLGATGGVLYTEVDWHKQLKTMSGGIDVVVDGAAGSGISKLISIANPGARIAIYGGTTGNMQEISPQQLFWKQASILGSTMGSPRDFTEMLAFVEKHRIVPIISKTFPLSDGNSAFDYVENGSQMGKVVLQI